VNVVAAVNRALKAKGEPEVLRAGRGYYYFAGGNTAQWPETAVYVYRAADLTRDEWLKQHAALKAAAPPPVFTLYRERDGDRAMVSRFHAMDAAGEYVQAAEADGTWPEGYDALLVCDGDSWIHTGSWERVTGVL
jgi:hypothetical protein